MHDRDSGSSLAPAAASAPRASCRKVPHRTHVWPRGHLQSSALQLTRLVTGNVTALAGSCTTSGAVPRCLCEGGLGTDRLLFDTESLVRVLAGRGGPCHSQPPTVAVSDDITVFQNPVSNSKRGAVIRSKVGGNSFQANYRPPSDELPPTFGRITAHLHGETPGGLPSPRSGLPAIISDCGRTRRL
jgi:hypothetical protein